MSKRKLEDTPNHELPPAKIAKYSCKFSDDDLVRIFQFLYTDHAVVAWKIFKTCKQFAKVLFTRYECWEYAEFTSPIRMIPLHCVRNLRVNKESSMAANFCNLKRVWNAELDIVRNNAGTLQQLGFVGPVLDNVHLPHVTKLYINFGDIKYINFAMLPKLNQLKLFGVAQDAAQIFANCNMAQIDTLKVARKAIVDWRPLFPNLTSLDLASEMLVAPISTLQKLKIGTGSLEQCLHAPNLTSLDISLNGTADFSKLQSLSKLNTLTLHFPSPTSPLSTTNLPSFITRVSLNCSKTHAFDCFTHVTHFFLDGSFTWSQCDKIINWIATHPFMKLANMQVQKMIFEEEMSIRYPPDIMTIKVHNVQRATWFSACAANLLCKRNKFRCYPVSGEFADEGHVDLTEFIARIVLKRCFYQVPPSIVMQWQSANEQMKLCHAAKEFLQDLLFDDKTCFAQYSSDESE